MVYYHDSTEIIKEHLFIDDSPHISYPTSSPSISPFECSARHAPATQLVLHAPSILRYHDPQQRAKLEGYNTNHSRVVTITRDPL
jgi:hypothetical protein